MSDKDKDQGKAAALKETVYKIWIEPWKQVAEDLEESQLGKKSKEVLAKTWHDSAEISTASAEKPSQQLKRVVSLNRAAPEIVSSGSRDGWVDPAASSGTPDVSATAPDSRLEKVTSSAVDSLGRSPPPSEEAAKKHELTTKQPELAGEAARKSVTKAADVLDSIFSTLGDKDDSDSDGEVTIASRRYSAKKARETAQQLIQQARQVKADAKRTSLAPVATHGLQSPESRRGSTLPYTWQYSSPPKDGGVPRRSLFGWDGSDGKDTPRSSQANMGLPPLPAAGTWTRSLIVALCITSLLVYFSGYIHGWGADSQLLDSAFREDSGVELGGFTSNSSTTNTSTAPAEESAADGAVHDEQEVSDSVSKPGVAGSHDAREHGRGKARHHKPAKSEPLSEEQVAAIAEAMNRSTHQLSNAGVEILTAAKSMVNTTQKLLKPVAEAVANTSAGVVENVLAGVQHLGGNATDGGDKGSPQKAADDGPLQDQNNTTAGAPVPMMQGVGKAITAVGKAVGDMANKTVEMVKGVVPGLETKEPKAADGEAVEDKPANERTNTSAGESIVNRTVELAKKAIQPMGTVVSKAVNSSLKGIQNLVGVDANFTGSKPAQTLVDAAVNGVNATKQAAEKTMEMLDALANQTVQSVKGLLKADSTKKHAAANETSPT
ncbi:hypothetical protein CYMTET_55559 [Cymbomonas tetramitiformis]|uniref:Uncharacterized protein n=1 Tax=Cymbomonas tetramitiformis TaxID=36881 RepID=A0AAE0BEJ7_9CHLO|nr:hypothetical protein CYMTET_55559 [Cymbomonas tetramitiformis]